MREFLSFPHPRPLFVLGNEKSGTTVIAASLAKATGQKVTLDIKGVWDPVQTQLYRGEKTIEQVIKANKYAFSKKIIKEPVLTFEYKKLKKIYPDSDFVLIVRDPRDNIRSILNRLGLPGDLESLTLEHREAMGPLWTTWNTVLDTSWLGIKEEHYIAAMAKRWNFIIDLYTNNQEAIILFLYEDFMADKVGSIRKLARQLNLKLKHDIENFVDIQFQSKGNRTISPETFFGNKNLNLINSLCGERMKKLGYEF